MNVDVVKTGRFSSSENNQSVAPSTVGYEPGGVALKYAGTLDEVMGNLTKKEAFKLLRELVSKMKVPSHCYEKPQWLSKNLATRNSEHKDFDRVMRLVDLILEKGWN